MAAELREKEVLKKEVAYIQGLKKVEDSDEIKHIGNRLLDNGWYDFATAVYDKYLEFNPDDGDLYYERIKYYAENGNGKVFKTLDKLQELINAGKYKLSKDQYQTIRTLGYLITWNDNPVTEQVK